MPEIDWTGITTIDPDTNATVHRVIVDGQTISVYVSLEVTEDALWQYQAVADGKIEEAIVTTGQVPTKVYVGTSDFRLQDA